VIACPRANAKSAEAGTADPADILITVGAEFRTDKTSYALELKKRIAAWLALPRQR